MGYDKPTMPSWNIHIAHVERLFEGRSPEELGIADANAFLFGNYAPDIYVGFMVPEASLHVDYCLTHCAAINLIPVPDADRFWDLYVARRRPSSPAGSSLALGSWAHLVADRFYNGRFRTYSLEHDMPEGDQMRIAKQADFDLFGRSKGIASLVEPTPELLDAAWRFRPYRILPEDVKRAADAANAIVEECGSSVSNAESESYRLLSVEWITSVFDACDERLAIWLKTWQRLEAQGRTCLAADVRAEAGLPPATPDDPNWMNEGNR